MMRYVLGKLCERLKIRYSRPATWLGHLPYWFLLIRASSRQDGGLVFKNFLESILFAASAQLGVSCPLLVYPKNTKVSSQVDQLDGHTLQWMNPWPWLRLYPAVTATLETKHCLCSHDQCSIKSRSSRSDIMKSFTLPFFQAISASTLSSAQ